MVVAVPTELQGRPFRRSEAVMAGLSDKVLRSAPFRRPFYSVYVCSDVPDTLEMRADAAALLLPSDAVFSHHTAAGLRGWPVPESRLVHVVFPDGRAGTQIGGIRVHRTPCPQPEVVIFAGRRVTAPERT
jgi:hypothetical protein